MTSTFLKEFADDLTEFEEGVIYGYPNSAIRAFAGLVEETEEIPANPWCYYLRRSIFKKVD